MRTSRAIKAEGNEILQPLVSQVGQDTGPLSVAD
jgi:hypothetical protein